ncbi:adenosylmethionine--8-amino-7-oxononanoate transaminase [Kocuria sp. M1R5S2]|uniref:adenosylmethionine--8-amino-7-oxononanoate transaminase n=1 Tax=Kocuria rhizosphaerae TaxID=3376285 RepID=UPI00378F9CCF
MPEDGIAGRDAGLLWHPYEALDGDPPWVVEHAQGVRLGLRSPDGRAVEAIDGMSSWWCAVHGYRNPVLDRAVAGQLERFAHVMFGGLTHEPAVELGERLAARTPEGLDHVFLADSGSVAVEVALKLAVQYQAARARPGRRRMLTVRGGYHGDTTGAMSVCDPVHGMHSRFSGLVAGQVFVPEPPAAAVDEHGTWSTDERAVARWTERLRATAAAHEAELAGVVVEPVLQGAGGMRVYAPECLRALREVADEHGLLLVADEIATGFGRTGRWFACEHAGVVPDVLCVGKALTGGYLSLAAVVVSRHVGGVISGSDLRALMHGPTFMGNPLACAVACASVDLLAATWREDVDRVGTALRESLAPARHVPGVRDVRTIGAVGVVQLDAAADRAALTRAALEHGVWLRPFRDLVYAMPPYLATDGEARRIGEAVVAAVGSVAPAGPPGRAVRPVPGAALPEPVR